LAATSGDSIVQGGTLTVGGASSFSAITTIDLASSPNQLTGAVALNAGGNASLRNELSTTLAASTVGGNLTVTSGSSLAESGVLTVTGTSSFTGPTSIDLSTSINQLGGAVALLSTGDTALHNGVATTLATSTVGGNLRVTSDASLAEAGVLTVNGTSFLLQRDHHRSEFSANQLVGSVTLSSGGN
jgi:hypothetical protein